MPKLHLQVTIDLEHMDEEIITEAITDVREALQYEFLEPVTVEQIFPENSPES